MPLLSLLLEMGNKAFASEDGKEPAEAVTLNGGSVVSRSKQNGAVSRKGSGKSDGEEEFIVHGLDYLPDFEKKRMRRRKNVPKFLRVDSLNWTTGYLNFLSRINASKSSTIKSEAACPDCHVERTANGNVVHDGQRMSRSVTAEICSEEDADEWLTHFDYPFENVVMSGGGSKGYAYIGSLKRHFIMHRSISRWHTKSKSFKDPGKIQRYLAEQTGDSLWWISHALEDCGILRSVKRIAGSSAGAICAGLLAVGCSPQDIADVFKCDIKWLFQDQTCTCCCCIPRVCHKYGVHPAKRFYNIYGRHIARKVGNPDITFKELQETYGRELCIVVTNLSRMCSEYCTPVTSPDLPIRDAVRMSMAFPLVFRAVRRNFTGRDCFYTDGGLLDQYPIHCFNGSEVEVNHNKETLPSADDNDSKTLGLYVVSEKAIDYKIWQTLFGEEIPYKPTYLPNTKLARARLKQELTNRKRQNKHFSRKEYMDELKASVGDNALQMWDHYEILNKSHVNISNFGEYFITAIETLLISQRKLHVKPSDVRRTVAINCGYIGTNDYVIEPGDREFMINQGYACTQRFLQEFVAKKKLAEQQQQQQQDISSSQIGVPTPAGQDASVEPVAAKDSNNSFYLTPNVRSMPNFGSVTVESLLTPTLPRSSSSAETQV